MKNKTASEGVRGIAARRGEPEVCDYFSQLTVRCGFMVPFGEHSLSCLVIFPLELCLCPLPPVRFHKNGTKCCCN